MKEALRQTKAQRKIETQRREQPQRKLNRQRHAISDEDFVELCKSGNTQAVEEAIIDGANVNAEVLLNHGADVDAKDNEGNTEIARLLREYGATE